MMRSSILLLVLVVCVQLCTTQEKNYSEKLANLWDRVKIVSANVKEIAVDNARVLGYLGKKAGSYVKETAVNKIKRVKDKIVGKHSKGDTVSPNKDDIK